MDGPGTEGTADFGSAAGIFWQTVFRSAFNCALADVAKKMAASEVCI
jgi:hypothetical protein